jgi:predicted MFS family arabinose efflux permease
MRLPEGLAAFRHRNFRLFWTGMLVSLIGTWMQSVGQAWLVLQLTNDPLALGIIAVAQFGPILVLGPIGGIVADSISKRGALMVTQTASGLLALILALLVVTHQVQVWHIFVLATGLGVVNSFDLPIRQAFVIEMVGREDIANAVALNSTVFNITRIIGPAIAGLTIAGIGIEPLFFVNAVSYLAVVVSLVMMRPSDMHATVRVVVGRHWRSVVDLLVEGFRYTRNNPPILLVIVLVGAVSTFAMNYSVIIPVVARDVLHGNADTYGFLMSAAGLGSLVSALSIAFRGTASMGRLFVGAALVGLAMVGVGVSRWLPLSLAMMFVAGWGGISMAATANTTIQLAVPDILRGRVVSLYTTVFVGSTPIGGLFSGIIASGFGGAPAALVVGGSVAALAAVGAYLRLPDRAHLGLLAQLRHRPARDH